jgi:predicted DsbA family dithiol-disulfide isomerase
MPQVRITEFTDAGCPFAYSAEPFRQRLLWLYGDAVEWDVRMVGLSDSPAHYEAMGFGTKELAKSYKRLAREHGMPIDTSERPRMHATVPACRAVVAARRHAPDRVKLLLRRLRIRTFSGALLDEPATIAAAARDAGIDPNELERWMAEPETEAELRDDMHLARIPIPAARILDHKLANWSGGKRYTCPSYEIERVEDGVRIAVPGFQPFAVYDVVLANLVPGLDRNPPPESVEDVLRWTATPLASKEVAVVCDIELDEARERLGRVAEEQHVGADGFWTLTASPS